MSKLNENLSEILNVEPIPEKKKEIAVIEQTNDDIQDDYELSRRTFRDLIKKGDDALEHLIEIAKDSEHPRSFEVVGTLIKTISDSATALMDLQKKKKDITETKKSVSDSNNITVDKAVFVGTPSDLLKKVKNEKV